MNYSSLIRSFILFWVLLIPSLVAFSQGGVTPGGAFYIDVDGRDKIPLLFVDDDFLISTPAGEKIDLSGKDIDSARQEILSDLSSEYKINSTKYVDKNDLVQITVLGDVSSPGNYWLTKNANLSSVNQYNDLFDDQKFDSSMTLVRRGKRTVIASENYNQYQGEKGDVFLISLMRKPEPEPVITSPENTSEEKSKSTAVIESEVESEVQHKTSDDQGKSEEQLLAAEVQNYGLQSGDVLVIGLPGEEGFNKDFLIDRDGTITLPEVGQLKIAGLPLLKVESVIYDRLSHAFLGLDKLSVQLKEKRLLVTVLGYVSTPGEVDLPNNGNVQMAINQAGGLINGAQLDKLQLQRDGQIEEFNFKQYLDSGDNDLIPQLQSLDVIFVPSSPTLGNVHSELGESMSAGMDTTEDRDAIKVFGEVIKPSSFPHKEGMNLVDALLRAGGVTRYANVEQIRVIDQGEPTLFNLKGFLGSGNESELKVLSKGATLFIPKQVDAVQGGGRTVYVMGQVQKPGSFETGNNVSFLDVLASAGGPNRYADTRSVRILRANGEVEPFNLMGYAEGSGQKLPDIMPGDAIFIPEKGEEEDQSWLKLTTDKAVQLLGAIKKPGRYEWSEKITFMDLLGHAGGPTSKADIAHIKIVAPGENGEAETSMFNMEEFIKEGGSWSQMPKLKGGSVIMFPDLPQSPTDNKAQWIRLPSEQAIYMMGAVNTPGRFAFNNRMNLLDLITAADGPSKDADLSKVRIVHRGEGAPRVSHVNLADYFETGDETLLPTVKTGDSVYIPSIERNWTEKKKEDMVRVLGAVTTSGRYDFMNDMTILDLLAEAGGPTKTAYIEKIIIVNTSCCKNQAYTFDLMDFMKDPDASRLPILRSGDTVYVPDTSMTYWAIFMDAVKDSLSVLSLVAIVKGF